ncbi:MAG: efflux RND transporter periplasmic adaptor subunit [Vicinamibacterales bacterium]
MKRLLWILGLSAIVAAAVVWYVRVDVAAAPPQLTFAPVSRGDVVATVEATGTLQPIDTVEVGTQVSGTIASLGTDFNQIVRKGQVIATLDPALLQSQVDQANATVIRLKTDLEQAQIQLEDAQLKLKRAEQLAASQLLPQQDVDTARSTARVAEAALGGSKAQLTQAQAALNQAQVNLSHTIIQSPTDGVVLSRNVEVGQTVSAGLQAPTLFIIARDLTKLELQARVDEGDIGDVKAGNPVTFTVDAYPRRTFTGTVRLVRLQPQTVQNVVTYTTVIDVPNADGALKPGMTSTASIEIARADQALRVPAAALRFKPSEAVLKEFSGAEPEAAPGKARRATVWQLVDGRIQAIPVRTSVSDGVVTAVAEGALIEGAQVITGATSTQKTATTTPASGSPLLPTIPRRPGNGGGGQPAANR